MITRVAAWAMKGRMLDPEGSVSTMLGARINSVSVMLNDYAGARTEEPFRTHNKEDIVRFTDACHAAGIGVTLTSWIMPYEQFITDAADQLIPLCEATGATELIWDAEEPWVRAEDRMDFDEAAALMKHEFTDLSASLALSGIASANTAALNGLAQACPIWYPQCYATTKPGSADPNNVVNYGIERWRQKFGDFGEFVIGLASYSQPTPPSDYMQPCIDQVLDHSIKEVCYWDLGPIKSRQDVSDFVATVLGEGHPPPVGKSATRVVTVPSEIDLNELRGKTATYVARVQGLLMSHGYGPDGLTGSNGLPDGKFGDKTQSALGSFKAAVGAPGGPSLMTRGTWESLELENLDLGD